MTRELRFYCGLHQPGDAGAFEHAFISINRLRGRKKPAACQDMVIDSGAFVELGKWGCYRHSVEEYAAELLRLYEAGVVNITAAVAQDYMCEPFMLAKTGLTVGEHQRLTIERYGRESRLIRSQSHGVPQGHRKAFRGRRERPSWPSPMLWPSLKVNASSVV